MARTHTLTVGVIETGARFRRLTLALPKALQRSHVEFRAGDALKLAAFPEGSFHVVAALNLICRLPRPRQFPAGDSGLAVQPDQRGGEDSGQPGRDVVS